MKIPLYKLISLGEKGKIDCLKPQIARAGVGREGVKGLSETVTKDQSIQR